MAQNELLPSVSLNLKDGSVKATTGNPFSLQSYDTRIAQFADPAKRLDKAQEMMDIMDKFATYVKEKEQSALLTEANNTVEIQVQDLIKQYGTNHGKKALDNYGEYKKAVEKIREGYKNTFKDERMRTAFDNETNRILQRAKMSLDDWHADQVFAFDMAQKKGNVEVKRETLTTSLGTPQEQVSLQELNKACINAYGDELGVDTDAYNAQLKGEIDDAVGSYISLQLGSNNFGNASAILNRYKPTGDSPLKLSAEKYNHYLGQVNQAQIAEANRQSALRAQSGNSIKNLGKPLNSIQYESMRLAVSSEHLKRLNEETLKKNDGKPLTEAQLKENIITANMLGDNEVAQYQHNALKNDDDKVRDINSLRDALLPIYTASGNSIPEGFTPLDMLQRSLPANASESDKQRYVVIRQTIERLSDSFSYEELNNNLRGKLDYYNIAGNKNNLDFFMGYNATDLVFMAENQPAKFQALLDQHPLKNEDQFKLNNYLDNLKQKKRDGQLSNIFDKMLLAYSTTKFKAKDTKSPEYFEAVRYNAGLKKYVLTQLKQANPDKDLFTLAENLNQFTLSSYADAYNNTAHAKNLLEFDNDKLNTVVNETYAILKDKDYLKDTAIANEKETKDVIKQRALSQFDETGNIQTSDTLSLDLIDNIKKYPAFANDFCGQDEPNNTPTKTKVQPAITQENNIATKREKEAEAHRLELIKKEKLAREKKSKEKAEKEKREKAEKEKREKLAKEKSVEKQKQILKKKEKEDEAYRLELINKTKQSN